MIKNVQRIIIKNNKITNGFDLPDFENSEILKSKEEIVNYLNLFLDNEI